MMRVKDNYFDTQTEADDFVTKVRSKKFNVQGYSEVYVRTPTTPVTFDDGSISYKVTTETFSG